jgi:type IV secretion system protein VirB1
VPLTVAAFIALAATCAPHVGAETLLAVAKTESALEPLAIHNNTRRESYNPLDKDHALQISRNLIRQGHSLDIGLLQVNTGNFQWLGLTLEQAFDPCSSIAAGAAVLTAFSQYNTGSPRAGFHNGYVGRVVKVAQALKDGQEATQTGGTLAKAVEAPRHDWDVFPDEAPDEQQSQASPTVGAVQPTATSDEVASDSHRASLK